MRRRGISLVILCATIIVVIILVSTIVISTGNIIEKTKKSEFAKEIYSIQTLLKEYNFKNGKYPISNQIEINLNDIDEKYKEQFKKESGYRDNKVSLNVIDLVELSVENVNRGLKKYGESDIYLVSQETGVVYYLLGENIGKDIYYTLTSELKSLIGVTK